MGTLEPIVYWAFGLQIRSNCEFPGPQRIAGDSTADVCVVWGEQPPWLASETTALLEPYYTSPQCDERGAATLRVWGMRDGAYHRLLYADGTEFIVDRSGTEVWATWPPELTLEDTATYFLGPILGLVMRFRGTVCLHASAVTVEGKAVALLGSAGAGKSTTAAAFAQLGFPIFSDDVLPLFENCGEVFVRPAYPHLRLWPDSVNSLFGSAEALPRLTPTWDKRYYDLLKNGDRFQSEPRPLAAIYILGERLQEAAAPFVESISARDGLMTLVAETYVNYLLDKEMRAREFELLSRVVRRIPLRRVRPHSDPATINRLCGVILDDFRGLISAAAQHGKAG